MSLYRFVLAEKARTPVSVSCGLLGVSRSGFHSWASRAPSDRALADVWLVDRIKAVHRENRGVYGARRVTAELRLGEGLVVSRKRVQRLMRGAGLSGLIRVKLGRTTSRVPGRPRRRRPRRATLSPRPTRRPVGRGHHLPPDLGGLGLPRRRPGCLQPASSAGRWPITCAPSSSSTRSSWRCTDAGPPRSDSPFRSGLARRTQGVVATPGYR